MTTIAYRDGVLVGDGRMTSGDIIVSESTQKVFKKTGEILGIEIAAFGITGHSSAIHLINKVIDSGIDIGTEFPIGIYFNILAVCTDGRVIEVNKQEEDARCHINIMNSDYHAAGSGYQIALGAMAAGANSVKAVYCAVKHNSSTGGDIKVIEVFKNER